VTIAFVTVQELASGRQNRSGQKEEARLAFIAHQNVTSRTSLGTQSGSALGFAWLFVVFATTHLFFDTTSFDQFAEATNGFLDTLAIT